ncbi:MAG: hypothetical protein PHR82_03625, partial [Endomicrobiaceae bacterium]|nr:hypothetical protein [Endomicrobiaceae bacterium]
KMKNILLMFLGILIALISLEILLQTSSFVILQVNKFNNQKIVTLADNEDLIKILCIGESTTFAQYPKQLVDYLNDHIHKDFVVIDCGVPGTNIENITERIDKQIEMYNPDIVISMMGANDAILQDKVVYKKYSLKIVSLFMLIKRHIENIAVTKLYADTETPNYSKLADSYFFKKEEPEELIKLAEQNPHDLKAIESLVSIYRMRQDYANVEKYANMFFKNSNGYMNTSVLFMLTDVYIQQKKYDSAKILIVSLIKNDKITDDELNGYLSNVVESYISFATLTQLTDYYNLLIKTKTQTAVLDNLYKYLKNNNINVEYYNYHNRYKLTGKQLNFNTDKIKNSYLLFAQKIIDNNIVYICMSYPTIPIGTFESFFNKSTLKNKIIFVSNEENFKEALKKEPYYKLFADNFGGTFGHCTKEGNKLIAENAGKKIMELIN